MSDSETMDASTDETPVKRERWWMRFPLWARIGAPAVVVLVVVATIILAVPKPFTVSGDILLAGASGDVYSPEEGSNNCTGAIGYTDISGDSTQVVVTDQSGTTVAVGHLHVGTVVTGDMGCDFTFKIDGVPGGKAFYKVEVSHRGGIQFTEKEMRSGVSLSLG